MNNPEVLLDYAREALSLEITEAQNLFNSLNGEFIQACKLILQCQGKPLFQESVNPVILVKK